MPRSATVRPVRALLFSSSLLLAACVPERARRGEV